MIIIRNKIWKKLARPKNIDKIYTYWKAMEDNNDIDNISEESQPDAGLTSIKKIDFDDEPLAKNKISKIIPFESNENLSSQSNESNIPMSIVGKPDANLKFGEMQRDNVGNSTFAKQIHGPRKSILKTIGHQSSFKKSTISAVHFLEEDKYEYDESEVSISEEDYSGDNSESSSCDGLDGNLQIQYEDKLKLLSNVYVSDIQFVLWKKIKYEEIWIKLWFTKFNYIQKVALWNKLLLPRTYLDKLKSMYK